MKLDVNSYNKDNLIGTYWLGIVEDNDDPKFLGRCKVRVLGKFDAKVTPKSTEYVIPTDKLPWSRSSAYRVGGSNTGAGNFSVPKLGTEVFVTFDNGNIYTPIYHWNMYPSDEVVEEVESSYKNSHVLIYDTVFDQDEEFNNTRPGEHIKVFFTESKGFIIDYTTEIGSSKIEVKPDNSFLFTNPNKDRILIENNGNITVENSNNINIITGNDVTIECKSAKISASKEAHIDSPRIKLGKQAAESVVKGDSFQRLFDTHIHPSGTGPTGPPTISMKSTLSKKNTTD